ncbi:MAG TPA: G1 family glutamic endopeptidase [Roseiflexaceae bacterium]|nr:G1 family glutamic endopeptidase [Roseiflexaceae bacterium]
MIHIFRQPTTVRRAALTSLGALFISLLASCASMPAVQIPTSPPAAPTSAPTATIAPTSAPTATTAPTNAPTATIAPTSAPAATTAPTSAPTATIAPTSAPTASPAGAAMDAIKMVIQQANHEQQQAVATHDPSLMRDTATSAYYSQAAQGLNDLVSAGVTAIQLVHLDWGPITLQGTTGAQATTVETWRTSFADGSTLQEADTNVYTLVLEGGAWKVQDDQHPDSRRLQPPQDTPGAAPTPVAPVAPGEAGQSRNWAGYAATGDSFTAVSGTWRVPTVSLGRTPAADATWIGIGGISSRDLIQAGTDATVQSGQVIYTAWIETLPQASRPVPLKVSPGDTVSVSITQQPDETWQIRIRNTTTGQSYEKSVTYQSSRSSAEWIEESPAVGRRTLLPLDNFGTVRFTGATTVEEGQQRTIAQAGGQAITMSSRTGQSLAQPSALGSDGASFSVSRTDATAPPIVPGSGDVPGDTLLS